MGSSGKVQTRVQRLPHTLWGGKGLQRKDRLGWEVEAWISEVRDCGEQRKWRIRKISYLWASL